jgi:hypothetical protein
LASRTSTRQGCWMPGKCCNVAASCTRNSTCRAEGAGHSGGGIGYRVQPAVVGWQ